MRKIKAGRIYGLISTLIIGGILATAIWVEPLTSTFTLGGHIAATAGVICVGAFFIAAFLNN